MTGKRLKKGDTIGIIAPAGFSSEVKVENAKKNIEIKKELELIIEYGMRDNVHGRIVDGTGKNRIYGENLNKFESQSMIYKHYLKECKNNQICAMEKYKGIQSDKTKPMAIKFVKQYREVLALEKKREFKK